MQPVFFSSPIEMREWLEKNHATADELWVGYFKKSSNLPSLTWPESVDEALCYGWIDGVRKRVDDTRYQIRFTPRRPGSIWSSVNVQHAEALIEQGRMQAAGLKAFQARQENRSGIYSYEQRSTELEEPYNSLLRQNQAAWGFLQAQSPSYKKAVSWWIISAKKEETRSRRLEKLIEYSSRGLTVPELTRPKPAA